MMEVLILVAIYVLVPILVFRRYFPGVYRTVASLLRWMVQGIFSSGGERGGQARVNPKARQRRYRNS